MTWSKEWPKEEGSYWLYGKIWSDGERKFHLVEMYKGANGISATTQGQFLYKSEVYGGVWQPVVFPEVPVVE